MKRTSRTRRPQLECLEPRRLLTAYTVDLGTLGGAVSVPADINASGQVVGTSIRADGGERAFFWQKGVMTDLGTLGGNYSRALGMNDAGQVVGQSASGTHIVRAFLVTPEDTDGNGTADRWYRDTNADGKNDLMRDLGTVATNYNYAIAYDVNNAGQVVGQSSRDVAEGTVIHAFRWQGGVMTDLGTFGGQHSSARTINDAGQIGGWFSTSNSSRAFLWKNGVVTDLGSSGGVNDIDAAGRLVDSFFGTGRIWTPASPNGSIGTFATLGQLSPGNPDAGVEVAPLGINGASQVVGYQREIISGENGDAVSMVGVHWINGVPQALRLEYASAINDAGQIVGTLSGRGYLLTEEHLVMPLLTTDGGAAVTEGNSGTANATITVSLSRASTQVVTVHYATADDSATAGNDYVATSGTLTFAPGQTSETVSVQILGDRTPEFPPAETFSVVLSSPNNALLAGAAGTGVILDDEPRIFSSGLTIPEGNTGSTTALVTVNLSVAYDQPVSFDYATTDQTAVAGSDYVATAGTVTFAPGETTKQIPVSILGDHVAEAYGYESGYLDLEQFGFTVSNPSSNVTLFGLGGVAIQDDEPRVTVSAYVPVDEPATGTTDAVFTVGLSAAYDQDVVVEYGTFETNEFGPPASAGSDYVATAGSVRIPAGQTSRSITVPVVGDGVAEPVEYFYVFLTGTSGNSFIDAGNSWGVGEIRDHPAPLLTISGATLTEGNAGTSNATFSVNLSVASAETVTVQYATADGAANAGSDYQAGSGRLTFAPGETHKTVSVAVNGDLLDENNESFSVNLSAATNARIGNGQGAGSIVDDDAPPSISVGDFRRREGRGGRSLLYFAVTLSAPSGKEVSVIFGTANGTARMSDNDYRATSGMLVFAPGETRKTIAVVIFGDRRREADETMFLNLRSATNATLRDAQGVGTILNDDR